MFLHHGLLESYQFSLTLNVIFHKLWFHFKIFNNVWTRYGCRREVSPVLLVKNTTVIMCHMKYLKKLNLIKENWFHLECYFLTQGHCRALMYDESFHRNLFCEIITKTKKCSQNTTQDTWCVIASRHESYTVDSNYKTSLVCFHLN